MADRKHDPIRDKYYKPLETAELVSDWLFYASAVLSLAVPLISKESSPALYNAAHVAFTCSVLALFVLSWLVRFKLGPAAYGIRIRDFLAHAYGIDLGFDQTKNYYTTNPDHPARRLASQLLENAHYSHDTAKQMARSEAFKVAGYAVLFVVAILNRNTDLGIIAIATQLLFSEQLLSKYLRLEWLRGRFKEIFDELYRLFQSTPNPLAFAAISMESFVRYEAAKANASVTLSEAVFNKRKAITDAEWNEIRTRLGL